MPPAGSSGTVGTLEPKLSPDALSTTLKSVQVPPMSMPSRRRVAGGAVVREKQTPVDDGRKRVAAGAAADRVEDAARASRDRLLDESGERVGDRNQRRMDRGRFCREVAGRTRLVFRYEVGA